MFIPKSTIEDSAMLEPSSNKITLMLVGDISNVTATLQQTDGSDGWNSVVISTEIQELSSSNTILSIYAPVKLRLLKSAGSDCGVILLSDKNKK